MNSGALDNHIYVPKEEHPECPAFIYKRFYKKNEELCLGFSVLDDLMQYPDFRRCSVFWLSMDSFEIMFKPLDVQWA